MLFNKNNIISAFQEAFAGLSTLYNSRNINSLTDQNIKDALNSEIEYLKFRLTQCDISNNDNNILATVIQLTNQLPSELSIKCQPQIEELTQYIRQLISKSAEKPINSLIN